MLQSGITYFTVSGRIVHESSGAVLANRFSWARSVRARMQGLIGKDLPPGSALIIEPAAQVHTLLLQSSIDVVFCDDDWDVRFLVRGLRPFRITRWVRGARRVIEMPQGAVPESMQIGDRLVIVSE